MWTAQVFGGKDDLFSKTLHIGGNMSEHRVRASTFNASPNFHRFDDINHPSTPSWAITSLPSTATAMVLPNPSMSGICIASLRDHTARPCWDQPKAREMRSAKTSDAPKTLRERTTSFKTASTTCFKPGRLRHFGHQCPSSTATKHR